MQDPKRKQSKRQLTPVNANPDGRTAVRRQADFPLWHRPN
jgi:hypothetical protein